MMRLIGLTGSIACGKSTVSNELRRRGYSVIDGDELSRELTGPGGAAVPKIRSVFGDRYFNPDGSLDRGALGKLVFSDSSALQQLDSLMAPFLRSLTLARIDEVRSSGAKLCFLEMPLLFEKGYDSLCDTVWCVWIPENLQLKRLMERDGFSREEALSRMRCVISSDEKAALAATVIDNSGTKENTLLQVSSLLEKELSRAETTRRRRSGTASSAADTVSTPPFSAPAVQTQAVLTKQSPVHRQPDPPKSFERPADTKPSDGFERPAGFERPDSARRKPSSRKKEWKMPRRLLIALITLSFLFACSVTAQLLMKAYLTRQEQKHREEQLAIDNNYPLLYRGTIQKIADEYNLSPALVAAVIRNESSFKPEAESSVGARGLMQLMPDTAKWIAGKLKFDDYRLERLTEPELNIRFGCWYLNYLSSLFNGNPLCVICAYHAGQGEISSWLNNPLYSSDGVTLTFERLPDGPTKTYAGRVTRDYGIYQEKYFSPSTGSADSSDSSAR